MQTRCYCCRQNKGSTFYCLLLQFKSKKTSSTKLQSLRLNAITNVVTCDVPRAGGDQSSSVHHRIFFSTKIVQVDLLGEMLK